MSNIIMNTKVSLIEDTSKKKNIVFILIAVIIPLVIFYEPRILYEETTGGYAVRFYTFGLTNYKTATIPETYKNKKIVELRGNTFSNMPFLESNSFLGAGSILAYHDLEIRGGGNLLGSEQSGHIEQIGYSLYLKMLEEQIAILSKKELFSEQKIDLKLNINAFLNSDLIPAERLRLELYRRLSKCESVSEIYEIGGEIEDRFGELDRYTKQFLDLITIKVLASKHYKAISNYEVNIALTDKAGEKTLLKAPSKDDDDILETLLIFLRKRGQNGVA